jgi:hypothetical protein
MWLNKGIPTLPSLILFESGFVIPFESGFRRPASGVLEGPVRSRHPASGFNVPPIRIILLFYFFIFLKKKITGTLEQIGQQYIKSLKLQDKIEVKCSKTVKYARTVGIKHFFTYDF